MVVLKLIMQVKSAHKRRKNQQLKTRLNKFWQQSNADVMYFVRKNKLKIDHFGSNSSLAGLQCHFQPQNKIKITGPSSEAI